MNFSISEILLVLVVALLVIKPEQLPDAAYKVGKWTKQFKDTLGSLRKEVNGAVNPLLEETTLKVMPETAETIHDSQKIT